MIRRTLDPSFLSGIANNPVVRPFLGGEGFLDLAPTILDPANFALVADNGGFVMIRHEQGVYEVHSMFLPGSDAVMAMREGMEYMFTRTDCEKLVTFVPDDNRGAVGIARAGNFKPLFRREASPLGPGACMAVDIDCWSQRSDALLLEGEWLHEAFERARVTHGAQWPDHPHDESHNRAAGAASLMVKSGNLEKGVSFYNRWARLAGYPTISIVQINPPTINMSVGSTLFIAEVRDGELETLLCQ